MHFYPSFMHSTLGMPIPFMRLTSNLLWLSGCQEVRNSKEYGAEKQEAGNSKVDLTVTYTDHDNLNAPINDTGAQLLMWSVSPMDTDIKLLKYLYIYGFASVELLLPI